MDGWIERKERGEARYIGIPFREGKESRLI